MFNSYTLICQLTCLSDALCFLKFFSRNLLNGLKNSPSTTFICKQLKIKKSGQGKILLLAFPYTGVEEQGQGSSESPSLLNVPTWPRVQIPASTP